MKSVRVIATAVEKYCEEAAARLAELFTPVLAEGEQLPDWQHEQRLTVRLIERLYQALEASHDALERKKNKLKSLRMVLDDATEVVYSQLLSLKQTLSGIRPRKVRKERWEEGKLPRADDPNEVWHGAEMAREGLREMEEAETDTGARFDPESWSDALRVESQALDDAIGEHAIARRTVEGLEAARRRRYKEFGDGFVRLAGDLEALYKLAGMDEAARIVQPSKKYPGRTAAEIRRLGKARGKARVRASEDGQEAS